MRGISTVLWHFEGVLLFALFIKRPVAFGFFIVVILTIYFDLQMLTIGYRSVIGRVSGALQLFRLAQKRMEFDTKNEN
jgi:hypothetical protein